MAKDTVLLNADGTVVVDADGDVVLADANNTSACDCCETVNPPLPSCCNTVPTPNCVWERLGTTSNPVRPTYSVSISGSRRRDFTFNIGGGFSWEYTFSYTKSGTATAGMMNPCMGFGLGESGVGSFTIDTGSPTNFTGKLSVSWALTSSDVNGPSPIFTMSISAERTSGSPLPVSSVSAVCPNTGTFGVTPVFDTQNFWIGSPSVSITANCGTCAASTSGIASWSLSETITNGSGTGTGSGSASATWSWSPVASCAVNAFA